MKILITAGTSGLGEAILRRLADGNEILFTYNTSQQKAQLLEETFSQTRCFHCDFSNPSDVELLQKEILEWQPDVLINNAYASSYTHTYFYKIDSTSFTLDFVNSVVPTLQITQTAIGVFRKRKSGKIITILTSYLFGEVPAGLSVYIANKAYLEKMTKAWATENSKFNITSNAVSPSFMLTAGNKEVDKRIIEQMTEAHPLKKLLTPAEAAESVYSLLHASPETNGINLLVNSANDVV